MDKSTTRPSGMRRKLLLLLIILIALLLWWFWPTDKKDKLAFGFGAQATPVAVAPVKQGAIKRSLNALGTVTASQTIVIRPRVEGTLLELNFVDGQVVAKDDVLALIDPEPFVISLNQALGQQIQNQAQLDLANSDLVRYERLFKQDSIAKQQLDDARAKVSQLKGQAKIDAAAVADAELQLSYTQIKAPAAGRLGMAKIDVGNLVGPADTDGLVVLTQDQPIDVIFALSQGNIPDLLPKYNQGTLKVQLLDQTNNKVLGTGDLVAIDNQIDTATGTVQLKASFDNQDRLLFPNQFVQVRLLLGDVEGLVIPVRAIQMGSQGEYVYQLDAEDKVFMTPVLTLVEDDANAVVAANLKVGDRVVIQGTDRLRTGSKVEIIED